MKKLIQKEIRLLLPAWIAAMLLAIVVPWILPAGDAMESPLGSLIQMLFSIGFLILGVASFGQEFNSGAFSYLLSQPLDRHRVWGTKTTILALAFFVVCLVAYASFLWRFNGAAEKAASLNVHFPPAVSWSELRRNMLEGLLISALVTFSGGLWTTLLLRQIAAAFWFTLLIPAAFVIVITAALQVSVLSDHSIDTIIIGVLVAYSVAGFLFARHLFLHAQDIQWTGGQIVLGSHWKNFKSVAVPLSGRSRHWLFALTWKEIQLHQANLLIALILLALNIASVCVLKIHPLFKNPGVASMLQSVGLLWLLMPLIIGSAAVASERSLGILGSQLCLPVSRRAQLLIKFLVALALSLFLGAAVPVLMNPALHLDLGGFGIAAGIIFFISFYASSFARTTVQAIGSAIVICAMTGAVQSGLFFWHAQTMFGLLVLTLYVGSAVLLLVFGFMTSWSFNWLHEYGPLWRRNVVSVLAAYVGILVLANGVFYRVWELFLPLQPPAGPARISNSVPLDLTAGGARMLYVVVPDGRLWAEALGYDEVKYHKYTWAVLSREKSRAQYIGGSNWVAVSADDYQVLGIQSDGTLWSIQRRWKLRLPHWARTFTLEKIGSDTDWSQVAGDSLGFILLKKNGTLWTWGTGQYNWNSPQAILQKFKLDRAELPMPIGAPDTFAKVVSANNSAYARKKDGTVWLWTGWKNTGWKNTTFISTLSLETNMVMGGLHRDGCTLGLSTNGAIFVREKVWASRPRYETFHLGLNAKWRAATIGPFFNVLAIRDDGTLWQWPPVSKLASKGRIAPVQMGSHSDWVALAKDSALALAADGSLWSWENPSRHIWLAPSRKPIYMGNIFMETEDAHTRDRSHK